MNMVSFATKLIFAGAISYVVGHWLRDEAINRAEKKVESQQRAAANAGALDPDPEPIPEPMPTAE